RSEKAVVSAARIALLPLGHGQRVEVLGGDHADTQESAEKKGTSRFGERSSRLAGGSGGGEGGVNGMTHGDLTPCAAGSAARDVPPGWDERPVHPTRLGERQFPSRL